MFRYICTTKGEGGQIYRYATVEVDQLIFCYFTGDSLTADIFRGRYNSNEYEPIALADLDLTHNRLSYLRANVFEHCPQVTRLSLAENPLMNIADTTLEAISSLKRLEMLNLSYTDIDTLPMKLFEETKVLRELFVQGNRFKTIPESVNALGRTLKVLNFGDNPIEVVDRDAFMSLKYLTHLYLDNMTKLNEIEPGAMLPLKGLQLLSCRHNPKLTVFDLDSLEQNTGLSFLDLSFGGVRHLILSSVADSTLNLTEYDHFMRLRIMHLDGNPWHCDCQLYRTLYVLQHHSREVFYTDTTARCATPYDISGLILSRFDHVVACETVRKNYQVRTHYDPPAFLRARYIVLTIFSVTVVAVVGTLVGFGLVMVKRRLKKGSLSVNSEVRYTTVGNDRFSLN